MKIFSSVVAAFDPKFSVCLPPQEELHDFLKQLSGCNFVCLQKERQLCILGSLEAIVAIQDSLSSFFKGIQQHPSLEISNCEIPHIVEKDVFIQSTELESQQDVADAWSLDNERDNHKHGDCLNIEVLHSPSFKNVQKKDFKFSCSNCSFKSQRESHYQKHVKLHEINSTIYNCDDCSFKTVRFTHLRRHQVVHSTKTFRCTTCNYSTDNPKLLTKHSRLKHKVVQPHMENREIWKCSNCTYKTKSLHLYERHMKVHSVGTSENGVDLFICSQCDYRTTKKVHYVRHRDVHRQWRPYLCDLCGKTFKRPEALKQHNLLHAVPEKIGSCITFQCLVKSCLKICHSRSHLKEHQAVHSAERSFLCEICGASFKTRSVQRKHVSNIHQNPGAFHCHCCTKRFNTNYALRRHLKLHQSSANVHELNQDGK